MNPAAVEQVGCYPYLCLEVEDVIAHEPRCLTSLPPVFSEVLEGPDSESARHLPIIRILGLCAALTECNTKSESPVFW